MTADEFNEKYSKYLEPGHYGIDIHYPEVIDYLDREFKEEIKVNPEFNYAQIKIKFGTSRVYANSENTIKWEEEIDKMLKDKYGTERSMENIFDKIDKIAIKNLNKESMNSTIKKVKAN